MAKYGTNPTSTFNSPIDPSNPWTGIVLLSDVYGYYLVIYKFGIPLLKIPIIYIYRSRYNCKTPWFYENTFIDINNMSYNEIINISKELLFPFINSNHFELKIFKKPKPNGDMYIKFIIYKVIEKYNEFKELNSPFTFGYDVIGINV